MLTVIDHRRDSAGLTYVYPVISRRAAGVSVGINLNTNNACNWACIYCQVPDLQRGAPPPVNLLQLENELRSFLHEALNGTFMADHVPGNARRLVDVAFSGNGEPTSAREFKDAVGVIEQVLRDLNLLEQIKIRLITNGSLLHRSDVRQGIARIGALNGEIWFKIDRMTKQEIAQINGIKLNPQRLASQLLQCCALAATWIQTCQFAIDGKMNDEEEQSAYLELIRTVRGKIKGVHLYGLARPSLQPDGKRLSNLPLHAFLDFAQRIKSIGVEVVANP